MTSIPTPPDATPDGTGHATVVMRYEDVAQNGRLLVESLATSVNESLWRNALRNHVIEEHAFAKGTLAILSHFVMETGTGPFHSEGPFESECKFFFAHGLDAQGDVDRIYLNAWIDTFAPIASPNFALKSPKNAGERALAGRAFAEHVFTRPFAAANDRKVTTLGLPGFAPVPALSHTPASPASLIAPPQGATRTDEALVIEAQPIAFGLRHTDGNQHVNSLVYAQLFEEASLRRLSRDGIDTRALATSLEIAYRKPCFAGQRVRIALARFERDGAHGTYGAFYDDAQLEKDGIDNAKPTALIRMRFVSAQG